MALVGAGVVLLFSVAVLGSGFRAGLGVGRTAQVRVGSQTDHSQTDPYRQTVNTKNYKIPCNDCNLALTSAGVFAPVLALFSENGAKGSFLAGAAAKALKGSFVTGFSLNAAAKGSLELLKASETKKNKNKIQKQIGF